MSKKTNRTNQTRRSRPSRPHTRNADSQQQNQIVTLTLTQMAHGGKAMGRNKNDDIIFVSGGIPGETVRVRVEQQRHAMTGHLLEIIKRSPDRIPTSCPESAHCTFQHINYAAQLRYKEAVVRDQLARFEQLDYVGKIKPIIPTSPDAYRIETILSPVKQSGGLGYWSAAERRIIPIKSCHALHPEINAMLPQIDLDLPELRKLTVRVGIDGHVMFVFAINEAEPPELVLDLPVSAALVFPDGVSATLIGDPYLVQAVTVNHNEQPDHFRVSAGSFFHPNLAGAGALATAVIDLAQLAGDETVVECFSGVGLLTRYLAQHAKSVSAIEKNPDAVDDAAVNLNDTDNVALYQDWAEDTLPSLLPDADLLVLDSDAKGIPDDVGDAILTYFPRTILYSNPEIGKVAQDAEKLQAAGYTLTALQPLDMLPQTHHIHTISRWVK